ncbi:pentapeptide repeat-containing protein [Amycolatopsis sp. GM8]|uniref:pentapeptide repeat-containing protein n=1 Tax=Amycolatopsis sp. GM8 TaxID=2896530 RepID=UPI001F3285D6|nr:pentapeptide repeat-containing protein [Amycolatopsis sp. GM8]
MPLPARRSRALSTTAITVWAVGLAGGAVVVTALLWWLLGTGRPEDTQRLDALRTTSSIVIGAAGGAALLLAARRQRAVELDLEQKDHDSTERRVTELYGKAADQLGSEKAPVRLAGIYALERLAQDHPAHRQTVVNLLCAYLRMPYEPPLDRTDGAGLQEREVRGAAQGVFEAHLQPVDEHGEPLSVFWPDIDLNLVGATLEWFWFRRCRVRTANFRYATFREIAAFRGTTFAGGSDFRDTRWLGTADLRHADFGQSVGSVRGFHAASFDGTVTFGAEVSGANLDGANARADIAARTWPAGWHDEPDPAHPNRVHVVRDAAGA